MALNKVYTRINWEDYPSENTDLDAYNLNQMDSAIDALDNRIISQDALKVDKSAINGNIADWTMDETTGIITITKYNGEKVIFDLNIEKIPVGFSMSDDGIITMTTEDGTQFTADIGSMIPVLTFEDSATIAVSVTGTGKNKTYSFSIKSGSVTGDMLQPNYLADVTVQAGKASGSASDAANSAKAAKTSETNAKASETAAKNSAANAKTSETNALSSKNSASTSASTAKTNANLSKSYAVGGTGTREGEDVDNAKYYMEQAKQQTGGIPTKVSELENDAGYIKKDVNNLVNYYDKTTTDKKLANINLTDYLKKTGDSSNTTVTFNEPTELAQPTTGEKLGGIIGKVSLAIKNIKTLISFIGNTDISSIGNGTVTGAITSVNSKLIESKSIPVSDAFETASGVSLSGSSHIIIKRGNAMYVELYFSGSIATGSDGQVKIGNIKSPYRPSVYQCCMTRINDATDGQIYAPALITVSTNGNVNLVTGANSKTYGNASYPWSTTGGIDFTYFL